MRNFERKQNFPYPEKRVFRVFLRQMLYLHLIKTGIAKHLKRGRARKYQGLEFRL